jgi:hypothetical protein
MRSPTTELVVRTAGSHRSFGSVRRQDSTGRLWRIRAPGRLAEETHLLISARYVNGDAQFGLRLRRVSRSRRAS